MGQLVLLVVAAAWAAVLLPPLLRSRVENRPNSSVVDFRRQLNRLQSTVPTRAGGSLRPVGRQLAPSPLQRPAAAGRPGQHAPYGRSRTISGRSGEAPRGHHTTTHLSAHHAGAVHHGDLVSAAPRPRRHGDATGGHDRAHRQAHVRRPSTAADMRRRRSNVLFMLVLATASTLFLAATTKATVMLYVFALSFLALCGYVYLLAQIRQREQQSWPSSWPNDSLHY